jgi:signal transduction histidine kinase
MKYLLTAAFVLSSIFYGDAQDSTIVLSASMFNKEGRINLGEIKHWLYKQGNDASWADPGISVKNWQHLSPADITKKQADKNGRLEGWFRIKIKLDSSFSQISLFIIHRSYMPADVFVNGKLFVSFGNIGYNGKPYQEFTDFTKFPEPIKMEMGKELLIAVHFVDYTDYRNQLKEINFSNDRFLAIANPVSVKAFPGYLLLLWIPLVILSILCVLVLLFWFLFFLNRKEDYLVLVALNATSLFGVLFFYFLNALAFGTYHQSLLLKFCGYMCTGAVDVFLPLLIVKVLRNYIPVLLKIYAIASIALTVVAFFTQWDKITLANEIFSFLLCTYYLILSRKTVKGAKWSIVIGLLISIITIVLYDTLGTFWLNVAIRFGPLLEFGVYLSFPFSMLVYVALRMREVNRDVLDKAKEIVQIMEEKKEILADQNKLLEKQVKERTAELTQSLDHLKATQRQLVQSEKMASLGELTAGIAHEIQNPLNFVNNFSEVSTELIDEMKEALATNNPQLATEIGNDLKENLEKINHHGKRADAIVKGMLQHSRSNTGTKESTDINALCDEYLRLAYHGLRAKDKSFNAAFKTEFDENIGKINIVPQDMGRVILNLINNAFYAVDEKQKAPQQNPGTEPYQPLVKVSTKKMNEMIEIRVSDNGKGIPEAIREKIFQPFFTTKPTGQGTGLGLSLSYDIVKAHGGELTLQSKPNEGTAFTIQIPVI